MNTLGGFPLKSSSEENNDGVFRDLIEVYGKGNIQSPHLSWEVRNNVTHMLEHLFGTKSEKYQRYFNSSNYISDIEIIDDFEHCVSFLKEKLAAVEEIKQRFWDSYFSQLEFNFPEDIKKNLFHERSKVDATLEVKSKEVTQTSIYFQMEYYFNWARFLHLLMKYLDHFYTEKNYHLDFEKAQKELDNIEKFRKQYQLLDFSVHQRKLFEWESKFYHFIGTTEKTIYDVLSQSSVERQ